MTKKSYIVTAFAAIMLAACAGQGKHASGKYTAVVSVEPLREIVGTVAGPGWEVTSLLQPGSDPETFDPTVATLRRVADADAFFTTGLLAFEQSLAGRLDKDGDGAVALSDGVSLIDGTHGDYIADPHIWASVRNAQVMARNAAEGLAAADPAHAGDYRLRADSLIAVYSRVDRRIDSMLRLTPARAFLVRHPSLTYFARDYMLEQVAVGADNKELSIASVRRAIDEAGQARAAIFFVESEEDIKRVSQIASDLDIPVSVFNPLSSDIAGQLTEVATKIAERNPRK